MQKGPALIDGSSQHVEDRQFGPLGVSAAGARRSTAPCDVRLTLTAHAEQVVLVRQVIGALAEALNFSARRVDDVRLAVTEACTNVVRHAYPSAPGPLEVTASTAVGGLTVLVSDRGCGLQPRAHGNGGGLGLPLMAALTAGLEIGAAGEGGTTVRLSFAADG